MKAVLDITKQSWSSRVSQQPSPQTISVEVEIGINLDMVAGIGNPSAMVKDISEGSITLVTSNLAPSAKGAGIDLGKNFSKLETVIKKGESFRFSTQTMDGGDSYTFTLTETK